MHKLRERRFVILAVATYWLIRLSAVVGTRPQLFQDSFGYLDEKLFGSPFRTWPVVLAYSLLSTNHLRVLVQTIIGCAAWSHLALTAPRTGRRGILLAVAVLTLGLSPAVTRFDSAVLSESLAISSCVFFVSLLIRDSLGTRRQPLLPVAWMLFVMIRPQHLLPGIAVGVIILGYRLLRRLDFRLTHVCYVIVGLLSLLQLSALSAVRDLNMYWIISTRVMSDSGRFSWWADHGMPVSEGIRYVNEFVIPASAVDDKVRRIISVPVGQDVPAIVDAGGTALARWVKKDAWGTYAMRVLSHPGETVDSLTRYLDTSLSSRVTTFLPPPERTTGPQYLFGTWQLLGASCLAGIATLAVAGRRQSAWTVILLLALTFALYSTSVLGSGIEVQRHAVTSAVMLRLAAVSAIMFVLSPNHRQGTEDPP